ncbi:diacylglycerol kinase [Shewanella sp. VB17]|uniref:diacylglycerol kinase n=1 Tax=Shewanella sp. VB17 TaxID=2739432 RepID=UPI0015633936|nr:diacylglycerol kinase [Shewanella sp. VB17]NRD75110.1 diacylglycerol kinase [Shewanella sp. VB17]
MNILDNNDTDTAPQIVIKRKGIMRLIYTCKHSFNGLKWMCKNEAAFQQELLLFFPLTLYAFLADVTRLQSCILIISLLFVLFAELVNTAIEVVVDRIGREFHPLSGLAKDISSAFVLVSLVIACLVWVGVLSAP